jgi:PKD repeat protein
VGSYIAIPEGAIPTVRILDQRSFTIHNVEIGCAPVIPAENDDRPLLYNKNMAIYGQNAFYPASPVMISEVTDIRGTDVVVLGITPFQYNPVTKDLVVYRDLKVTIECTGGNGTFGDDAFRSRFWDPMMSDQILNFSSLPAIDYNKRLQSYLNSNLDNDECEYIIITPEGPDFLNWADSVRRFRIEQGILTKVFTLTDVGGNTTSAIKAFIDNAYNNWTIKPSACLLFGDYGTDATKNVISYMYPHPAGYPQFASDNYYADVTGDNLPDVVMARIVANNNNQLTILITKILDYERNPPTDFDFYDKPVTALGWQTERWFQLCSEITGGFFLYEHSKHPRRINALYQGNPNVDPWSTATNTSQILSYFGPSGLAYIPSTPQQMPCCWTGGNATKINQALDSGAFAIFHRDHGEYTGWGEPSYHSNNIDQLNNTLLTFVWSINCQTGAYHRPSECFAERFVRHTKNGHNSGAVGIIAASEVSYSFVNDTYLWGSIDNLWTDFMPDKTTFPASRGLLPAFGNAAGKHFLKQSSWPYNSGDKLITYRLFHHLGDAFQCIFSEIPIDLSVTHDSVIEYGSTTFTITANDSAFIALTVADEIIATAYGDDSNPVIMTIPVLPVGTEVLVTVTKTNFLRYSDVVEVTTESLIANFSANITSLCVGSSVDFTDMSTGSPETWAWEFQGGTPATSGDQNPSGIFYNTAGNYDVTLTVTKTGQNPSTTTKTGYILVINLPEAAFQAPNGCAGQPVQFTDESNPNGGQITDWQWDFGDSNTSNEQNPAHTYDTIGTYTVTLTVTVDGLCSDAAVAQIEITTVPGVAGIPVGPADLCEGLTGIDYTSSGASDALFYIWEIYPAEAGTITGSSTTGTVDLTADYTGTFTLKVEGVNDCGEGAFSDELTVMVNDVPDISGTPEGVDSVNLNLIQTADFTTTGAPTADSYAWTLVPSEAGTISGDGTTGSATFNKEYKGIATLNVKGINECGESLASEDKEVTLYAPVGIAEHTGVGINVFPNPTTGTFTLELTASTSQNVNIRIFNTLGASVYTEQDVLVSGKTLNVIHLTGIPEGIYYIRIETGSGNIIQKLVIR